MGGIDSTVLPCGRFSVVDMTVLRGDAVIDAEDETAAVIRHDARNLPLDDATVDLIVTSPPYFALRSYRDAAWRIWQSDHFTKTRTTHLGGSARHPHMSSRIHGTLPITIIRYTGDTSK